MKRLLFFLALAWCLTACVKRSGKPTEQKVPLEEIQASAEKILKHQMDSLNASGGAVAIMEVSTGKLVAWIEKAGKSAAYKEDSFLLQTSLEPGSLMLPISMMIAMEDGKVNPSDTIDTFSGYWMFKGQAVLDHNASMGGYGVLSSGKVISLSSNVGMARIISRAYGRTPGAFLKRLKEYGWNFTSLDAVGGENGAAPSLASADMRDIWASFGYGIQMSPLTLLEFYNALANEGCRVHSSSNEQKRVLVDSICSKNTRNFLLECLENVVKSGTAKNMASSKIRLAGKTGNVQLPPRDGRNRSCVSFCGYFPVEKPVYTCLVILRDPKVGKPSGGRMAGDVFEKIAENLLLKN